MVIEPLLNLSILPIRADKPTSPSIIAPSATILPVILSSFTYSSALSANTATIKAPDAITKPPASSTSDFPPPHFLSTAPAMVNTPTRPPSTNPMVIRAPTAFSKSACGIFDNTHKEAATITMASAICRIVLFCFFTYELITFLSATPTPVNASTAFLIASESLSMFNAIKPNVVATASIVTWSGVMFVTKS